MIKVIALLKMREGMGASEFIDYYENQHAPLIRSLTRHLLGYKRNYVNLEGSIFSDGAGPLDFDVITEFLFKDNAAYEAAMGDFSAEDAARKIAEDEENVFDRSMTRFFRVRESDAELPG